MYSISSLAFGRAIEGSHSPGWFGFVIYSSPLTLLSQPAGFYFSEGILRGMCGRKPGLKVVGGKIERRYAYSGENFFSFFWEREKYV